jgi:hypothetical protein
MPTSTKIIDFLHQNNDSQEIKSCIGNERQSHFPFLATAPDRILSCFHLLPFTCCERGITLLLSEQPIIMEVRWQLAQEIQLSMRMAEESEIQRGIARQLPHLYKMISFTMTNKHRLDL